MYPEFRFDGLSVSSFSAATLIAWLVGTWLATRQARYTSVNPSIIWRGMALCIVAGLFGAKLYAALVSLPAIMRGDVSAWHAGQVWYGSAIFGIATAVWWFRNKRTPVHLLLDYDAAPLAFGHAIGRVGCFLVGDDYGLPTDGPLGVAFRHGLPPSTAGNLRALGAEVGAGIPDDQLLAVHPTQLYEVIALLAIGMHLWHRSRRPHRRWTVWGEYLLLYGAWRFAIEFLRVKDDVLPIGLTSAQLISLMLVAWGAWLLRPPGDQRTIVIDDA